MARRTEAIDTVATYSIEVSSQTGIPFESALQSVIRDHRPLFCFICLGQKDLDIRKRVQKFFSYRDVTKYIKRKHLQNLVSNAMILLRLNIRDGYNEPILLLDLALDDIPVFRYTERTHFAT
ncbi:uncharacterized protein N7477_003986 [Penicillium maclennaniae]|uniref:uncharacterized protein n=1 Tax=Penicillium maclennaniae TaxID=1343394 RepID=UPI0025415948|nr:uncharacterized protein N7477_003986 [Penicillium maclennaniae]KAJ5678353.1 hypothetical protein N7477_003986 [Penicillium maclennaniae]